MFSNISNPLGYLAFKLGGSKGAFTFRAPNGIRLEVPRRLLSTFKEMFFRMPYVGELPANFISSPSPLVIDIGANVGYFSFYVLSKFPKATVHSFEPFPPNFKLLSQYRSQHPQLGLHVHPFAVAGRPGSIHLHYNAADEFSTSAAIHDNAEGSQIEVKAVTLPDFVREHKITHIDWLKVDCEGAEYEIFRELPADVLKLVQVITLEHHPSDRPGETPADLERMLRDNGFTVRTNGYSPLIWAWRS